jgi:hypothetical protein
MLLLSRVGAYRHNAQVRVDAPCEENVTLHTVRLAVVLRACPTTAGQAEYVKNEWNPKDFNNIPEGQDQ